MHFLVVAQLEFERGDTLLVTPLRTGASRTMLKALSIFLVDTTVCILHRTGKFMVSPVVVFILNAASPMKVVRYLAA